MLTLPDFQEKQIIFALLSRGERLSFRNDNVIISDTEGKIKHQSSCYRLFLLLVVGHVSITSGLLQRAKKFRFTIVLLSHSLQTYGYFSSQMEGNVFLRQKQYSYKGWEIARHLVENKIGRQIQVLKNVRKKTEKRKESVASLTQYRESLSEEILDLQRLLGIEGISSRVYFQSLFTEFSWISRRPRVKQDMTNALLDIGYTLLFNIIEALLGIYGFDLYQGVYHRQFYQRKSLVCDLVEPFRPLVDARIYKGYRLGQIREEDFSIIKGQYRLFGKQSQNYVSWLLENLLDHKKEMFLYVQGYYRAFMKGKRIEEYPIY